MFPPRPYNGDARLLLMILMIVGAHFLVVLVDPYQGPHRAMGTPLGFRRDPNPQGSISCDLPPEPIGAQIPRAPCTRILQGSLTILCVECKRFRGSVETNPSRV